MYVVSAGRVPVAEENSKNDMRKVLKIDRQTGEVVKEYRSIADAAKEEGISASYLAAMVTGRRDQIKEYKYVEAEP